jgi:uncharacterized membrane protein YebE (DUF533 family)
MKMKFLLILAIIFGSGICTTNAQIKHRSLNQHHRINEGVKSGELTKTEAHHLRKDQKNIHQAAKAARSDGKITRRERKNIKKEERRNSGEIYRKKHNLRERE